MDVETNIGTVVHERAARSLVVRVNDAMAKVRGCCTATIAEAWMPYDAQLVREEVCGTYSLPWPAWLAAGRRRRSQGSS